APAATNGKRIGEIGVVVAVEVMDPDLRVLSREMREDRKLLDAVAAPRPADDEHLHLADETSQHVALRLREPNLGMDGLPAPLLFVGRILGEELVVRMADAELRAEIHDHSVGMCRSCSRIIVA